MARNITNAYLSDLRDNLGPENYKALLKTLKDEQLGAMLLVEAIERYLKAQMDDLRNNLKLLKREETNGNEEV